MAGATSGGIAKALSGGGVRNASRALTAVSEGTLVPVSEDCGWRMNIISTGDGSFLAKATMFAFCQRLDAITHPFIAVKACCLLR